MATVEDAIEALTDPACRVTFVPPEYSGSGLALMSGDRVIERLRERGCDDEQALALIDEALPLLRAFEDTRTVKGGALAGGPVKRVRVYAVPVERVRSAG